MKIAFAGFFAIRLAELVRAHLSIPCEVIEGDEAAILPRLADADVLGLDGLHAADGRGGAAPAPGAGAGRRPRSHRPRRVAAGPAPRQRLRPRSRHRRIRHRRDAGADALVRHASTPACARVGGTASGRSARPRRRRLARARRQDARHPRLRPYRPGARPPRRGPSTCRSAPSGGRRRRTRRRACRSSAAPSARRGAAPVRLSRRHALAVAETRGPARRAPPAA